MGKTIIAGPCSVESHEQLREVTAALCKMPQVNLIRCGVWKPRTRPGGFEGLGEPALRWMQELSTTHNVQYCCEVARPEHVEMCLHYGLSTIWLGARTTTNPFMVGEICEALQGSGMNVLVKNPVCPDVRLWLGAVERLQQVGIGHISAVHRGFSMYHNNGYRNAPLWAVAMEFRREMPDIPILCDPSHIGGRADLLTPLSTTAMLMDYDGLMIEVHPHPADAWTDAVQQISPDELARLLSEIMHTPVVPDSKAGSRLAALRDNIDNIDHSLLRMLSQRMELSRQIATIKHELHMPVYQSSRWADVMRDRLQLAESLGLNSSFTKEMLERIHAESVRVQLEP